MKPTISPSVPSIMAGVGSLALLGAVLVGAPAGAVPVVHAPAAVDTSIPTPPAATNVHAKRKVMRGKAKVWWSVPSSPSTPSGYNLYVQIDGSQGGGSKGGPNKPGQGCVKAGSKGFWCIVKRLPKGSTTFTVQLWYQPSKSSTQGPASTSAPSNSVNIK